MRIDIAAESFARGGESCMGSAHLAPKAKLIRSISGRVSKLRQQVETERFLRAPEFCEVRSDLCERALDECSRAGENETIADPRAASIGRR